MHAYVEQRIIYGPIPQPDSVPHRMGTVPLAEELQMVLIFLHADQEPETERENEDMFRED